MADKTFSRVASLTKRVPLMTWDTVAIDTPARLATSLLLTLAIVRNAKQNANAKKITDFHATACVNACVNGYAYRITLCAFVKPQFLGGCGSKFCRGEKGLG
jgi:hypothetical protein